MRILGTVITASRRLGKLGKVALHLLPGESEADDVERDRYAGLLQFLGCLFRISTATLLTVGDEDDGTASDRLQIRRGLQHRVNQRCFSARLGGVDEIEQFGAIELGNRRDQLSISAGLLLAGAVAIAVEAQTDVEVVRNFCEHFGQHLSRGLDSGAVAEPIFHRARQVENDLKIFRRLGCAMKIVAHMQPTRHALGEL